MGQSKVVTPPAKSLLYGLRNMGYNFSTALADIIDNSISAGAKNIEIFSNPDVDSPYVVIFDDGCGMGRRSLENAMTIGSNRDDKEDSELELGRFGLGLKSASFSQCLKLIVASKDMRNINAMSYDLNEIESKNDWWLQELDQDEIDEIPQIDLLKQSKTGTLVMWENFDKIEEEAHKGKFNESFISAIDAAKKHVEYVFHRFYGKVNISFNGHLIEKRDPFLSEAPKTQVGREQTIDVGEYGQIKVKPFVLPNSNTLTQEQKHLLGDPKSIYDEQGLYIYRNKRLILWGSWLKLDVRSEFNKLARVRVDIPSSLDSVWKIDVKKSSAKIPDFIKEQLRISINDAVVKSKREVKYRGKKEEATTNPIWQRLPEPGGKVEYKINRDYEYLKDLILTLNDEQNNLLEKYLRKIEQCIPLGYIHSDIADSLTITNSEDNEDEDALVDDLVAVGKLSKDPINCVDGLLNSEVYRRIKNRRAEILEKIEDVRK